MPVRFSESPMTGRIIYASTTSCAPQAFVPGIAHHCKACQTMQLMQTLRQILLKTRGELTCITCTCRREQGARIRVARAMHVDCLAQTWCKLVLAVALQTISILLWALGCPSSAAAGNRRSALRETSRTFPHTPFTGKTCQNCTRRLRQHDGPAQASYSSYRDQPPLVSAK